MLNTTTQIQNITMSNIFNLTSQLMEMITGVTVERSNPQNNVTSNVNTEGENFSYFGIIGANLVEGFGAFGNSNNNPPPRNNNNNNLPPSLLSLPGFRRGLGGGFNLSPGFGRDLEGGFNLLPGKNTGGLDLNVAALVNALTGVNLGINYIKRESNHVKLTEFGGTEAEDPNKWLEYYNRITEANKWSEHRKFHKRVPCGSSSKIVR